MIKPRTENKYNIKPKDLENMIVLDKDRISQNPFTRNDSTQSWDLSGGVGYASAYCEYGDDFFKDWCITYRISFFDNGKIELACTSHYDETPNYTFETFFNNEEIEDMLEFEIQDLVLEKSNWLIDENIIGFR